MQDEAICRVRDGDGAVRPVMAHAAGALEGVCHVGGDKSLSHRALILGGVAAGRTRISGLLESEDVLHTVQAMRAFGARIVRHAPGEWCAEGAGAAALAEPEQVIDCGNSGTAARLLMGLMASSDIHACFTGDASLCARPMGRVLEPLRMMGAEALAREGERMPLAIRGARYPLAISYRCPVPSAQVKSAVLLAGLNSPGQTCITEPVATRDHTERMLRLFGAKLDVEHDGSGGAHIRMDGWAELKGQTLRIPRDPSSAAFPLVAGLIVPGSAIAIPAVGVNPARVGLLTTLREMGADIQLRDVREESGEPIADLFVRHSALKGIDTPPGRAAAMIDEFPILAVAACFASGKTIMNGIGELRVKESDRIAAMAEGLARCGVQVETGEDRMLVHGAGAGGPTPGESALSIPTCRDHRIAMAFLCFGMATCAPIGIDDIRPVATSFPDFLPLMRALGADLRTAQDTAGDLSL